MLEKDTRDANDYNYYKRFKAIYSRFSRALANRINKMRRHDICDLYLNGRCSPTDVYVKGKMSFINAWTLFVLQQQKIFKYHQGNFPQDCGAFIFKNENGKEYHIILRHGTDKNKGLFKTLNKSFIKQSAILEKRQLKQHYNEFSMAGHWSLEYWSERLNGYVPKKYFVSAALNSFCSVFLTTLEGLIYNFVRLNIKSRFSFRMTLHRLVCYSNTYYFQQISKYVGNRIVGDVGRAFPIDQGIVGLAMRTNTCCSLIRETAQEGKGLLNYEKMFARHLPQGVKSFFVVPIPSLNQNFSTICLYMDTNEKNLISDKTFREMIYWSLTSFIREMENKNVEKRQILDLINADKMLDERYLKSEIINYNDEINDYWKKSELKMRTNRLIDIYE